MKIGGSHHLPVEPRRAYELLLDPEVLARCLPGCQGLERIGDDEYRMKMKAVMGSVSGLFDSTVRISDQEPPARFRMTVEGTGKIGFLKGDGLLSLSGDGGATEVA
ncbi:MAG: carbon monoxide dehydrogenase subunit G, partial [bacterium]|nr:carbon monoxide dehydrogenase subunit G [bacterium]